MSLLILLYTRYIWFAFSKTQEIFCFILSNREEIWVKDRLWWKRGKKMVLRMFPLTHHKLHLSSLDWGLRASNSLTFIRKTIWVLCRVFSCLWQQLVKKPFSSTDNSVSFWPSKESPQSTERQLSWWYFRMASGCSESSISTQGSRCGEVEAEVREQYPSNTIEDCSS